MYFIDSYLFLISVRFDIISTILQMNKLEACGDNITCARPTMASNTVSLWKQLQVHVISTTPYHLASSFHGCLAFKHMQKLLEIKSHSKQIKFLSIGSIWSNMGERRAHTHRMVQSRQWNKPIKARMHRFRNDPWLVWPEKSSWKGQYLYSCSKKWIF